MKALANALAGTGALVRLILRRERIMMPACIALVMLFVVGTASYYAELFPTEQARADYAQEISATPALRAFGGQVFDPQGEAMTIWRASDTGYTLMGLIALLTVIRHTRTEEESGRQELLGAGAVGRYAPLTASLAAACGGVLLTGLLISLGLIFLVGLEPVGSLAFGLAIAAVGWVFAAVAAVTAQIFERSRAAIGTAVAVLGAGYALRFVADGSGRFQLKWLTPVGWGHFVRPFADERWWVLSLPIVATLVMVGVSYLLVAHRDLGSGLLPERPGPAAGPWMRGPLSLAWRLQRGLLAGWTLGLATAGVLFGALVGAATGSPDLVGQSPVLQEFIRRYTDSPDATFQEAFLWLVCATKKPQDAPRRCLPPRSAG
jgi:ABC-2 type transport system permease protein